MRQTVLQGLHNLLLGLGLVILVPLHAADVLADEPATSGVGWALVHLDLEITLLPEQEKMQVKGEARVRLDLEESLGPKFAVNSRTQAMSFKKSRTPENASASLNGGLSRSKAIKTLEIRYPGPLRNGAEITVPFAYESVRSSAQFFVKPEIAVASWVESWYPVPIPRLDRGERMTARVASAPGTTRFHLPPGWRSISNGKRLERNTDTHGVTETWELTSPVARSFAAAAYKETHHTSNGRDIGLYLLTDLGDNALRQVEKLSQAIDAMENRFGPYPYDGYAIAEVPFTALAQGGWGASSEQGFILAGSHFIRVEGGNLPLFAHEAAHSWWGNLVNTRGRGSIVCSETLSQYGAVLAIEAVEGPAAATEFLRFSRAGYVPNQCAKGYFQIVRDGKDLALSRLGNGGVNHTLSDAKGHWVFHMLRRRIGDEVFFPTLQGLVRDFAGKSISLGDIRSAFLNVAPEEAELSDFLRQWFDWKGAPVLEMDWTQTGGEISVTLHQRQRRPFNLRVDIEMETDEGTTRHRVALREPRLTVEFPVQSKVTRATLDPDHAILKWEPEYGPCPPSLDPRLRGVESDS